MDKDIETGSCQSRVADSDNTSNLIHIARGGGRGTYTHADGDFHCAHRNKAFFKEDSKNDYPDLDVSVSKGVGGGEKAISLLFRGTPVGWSRAPWMTSRNSSNQKISLGTLF